jgi:hypothetical protein
LITGGRYSLYGSTTYTLTNNSRDLCKGASGIEVRDASTVFSSGAPQEIYGHIEGRERSGTVFSRILE